MNLHDKSYHILNEPLSPEEYERRLREIEADPAPYLRAYVELLAKLPRRDIVSLGNEDTSGSGIFYSKSVHHAYDIYDAQDCRYVFD